MVRESTVEITEDLEQPFLSDEIVSLDGFRQQGLGAAELGLDLPDDCSSESVNGKLPGVRCQTVTDGNRYGVGIDDAQIDVSHETGFWREGPEAGMPILEISSIFEGNASVRSPGLQVKDGEEEGLASREDALLLDSKLGGGARGVVSSGSSGGDSSRGGSRRRVAASDNLESLDYEVLDSEWHDGEWQSMTQADRIRHTALRWLLVLLIGACTGALAFLINLAVEAIGSAKFGLVFSHIKGQNFLWGFLALAASNLGLVLVSTCLCNFIAMEAAGSGIPEVKGYLNGVSTPAVLSAKTLFVKALGSIGAVAGGLAVGKEGPLVHSGACIANILGRLSHRISASRDLSRPFPSKQKPRLQSVNSFASLGNMGSLKALRTPVWVHSDRGLRDLVTCGAASGVAAAFLAPVGGVLFALEEVTSWWRNSLIWRIFFTNAVVAMVLRACISLCEGDRCGGSFGSRGFILFDRSKSQTEFGLLEIVPAVLLGVVGGVLGGVFNHMNVKLCAYRKNQLHRHGAWVRVLEVLLISLLTSAIRFYGPFLASCLPCPEDPEEGGGIGGRGGIRALMEGGSFNCPSVVGTGDHKAFACPDGQYNDLASLVFTTNDDAIGNLFRTGSFGIFTYSSLLLSFAIFFALAILTYGIAVPSGLFVPSILCGASYGRMAGMLMAHLFGSHRVGEGTYALLGAASFLGGSMRMTVSLSVILLELTGSLKLLPLIMVVLLVSKNVGDLFNRNIYDSHVHLKGIPYLPENCTHQDFTVVEGEAYNTDAAEQLQLQQQQQQQQEGEEQQKQELPGSFWGLRSPRKFSSSADLWPPQSPRLTPRLTTPFPASPSLVTSPLTTLFSPRSPGTPNLPGDTTTPSTPRAPGGVSRRRATAADAVAAASGAAGAAARAVGGLGSLGTGDAAVGAAGSGYLVALEGVTTVKRIVDTLRATQHNSFPVVDVSTGRERAASRSGSSSSSCGIACSSSSNGTGAITRGSSSSGSSSSGSSSSGSSSLSISTSRSSSTSSTSCSSSSRGGMAGHGLLRVSSSGTVLLPNAVQAGLQTALQTRLPTWAQSESQTGFLETQTSQETQTTSFHGLILRKHLLALLHSKKAFHPQPTTCSTPSVEGRARILRDFAASLALVGKLRVQDLEITPEEEGMFVDLHPYTNRSPYIVTENMGMQKAYLLFRNLGLRHLCVVPKPMDVIGIITRKDLINAMCREHDAPENHCR
ncbi:hypothetical protein CLOM_g7429 [Closterium sp. NIES-68]|nr:hypothetical protein CLOM_g7429 [Closterium sp. NIES-68]GJP83697.1 hypothetical protein CLOP_g13823 [Closterium sp. NIES-67]